MHACSKHWHAGGLIQNCPGRFVSRFKSINLTASVALWACVDASAAAAAGVRWSQTAWMWRGSPPASQAASTRPPPASRWLLAKPRQLRRWPTCSRREWPPAAPTAACASSTPMRAPRSEPSTSPPVIWASLAHPSRSVMPLAQPYQSINAPVFLSFVHCRDRAPPLSLAASKNLPCKQGCEFA